MITIQEAVELILNFSTPLATETIEISASLGRVVAQDIRSDVDSPPHDKSLVDGFALIAADTVNAPKELTVVENVFASQIPSKPLRSGQTTRIMTGAPLPLNADAVAMVEWTETKQREQEIAVIARSIAPETNVQRQATVFAMDDIVIPLGKTIRPIEVGLMAEVGCARLVAYRQPRVSVLPTGDELVEPTERPAPGSIRNSNGPMLQALVAANHAIPYLLEVGRDDRTQLKRQIESGLQADVLVMSGGVSMGQKDLVPDLLQELGVRQIFHRVQLRPGKPIWFGVLENESQDRTIVFGLPGNPLSSFVCFHLFVVPAIRRLMGMEPMPALPSAELHENVQVTGNRPAYLPVMIRCNKRLLIDILPWNGSADMRTLSIADGMAFFPKPGDYQAGHQVDFLKI